MKIRLVGITFHEIFYYWSSRIYWISPCKKFIGKKHEVLGFDAITSYYDVSLKNRRIENLKKYPNFFLKKKKLEDKKALSLSISKFNPDIVFHLAAQAGVRYSLENPTAYINSNIIGTFNLLEILKEIDD